MGCNRSQDLTYPELVSAIEGETKELERLQESVKSMERDVEKKAMNLRELVQEGSRNEDKLLRNSSDLSSANDRAVARKEWEKGKALWNDQEKKVSASVKEMREHLAINKKPIEEQIEKQKALLMDLRTRRDEARK